MIVRICPLSPLQLWSLSALVWLHATAGLQAADWPQFLGPDRNGVSGETIRPTLPADGPPIRWSMKLGTGWSGPVVAGGRLLIHHRLGNDTA